MRCADLVAVELRQADVEQHDVGPEALGRIDRFEAVVGGGRFVALSSQQHGQARGRVAIVVDDQDASAVVTRSCSPVAVSGLFAGALSTRTGKRTMNSLPCPRPVAAGFDAAAVHFDQPLDQGEADSQPPLRRGLRAVDLREHVEDAATCSGAMPMPLSLTETTTSSPSTRGAEPEAPAGLRVLGGCCSANWRKPGPGRPGSASSDDRLLGQVDRPSDVARLVDERDWQDSTACATTSASSTDSRRSSMLSRVMRLTSSRSSTSRTICSTCRSIMSRARRRLRIVAAAMIRSQCIADGRQRVAELVGQRGEEFVLTAIRFGQVGGQLP